MILLCFSGLLAQASEYPSRLNFVNIMTKTEFALGEVEAIVQDRQGFVWLGGRNGLLRYDGYEFVEFQIRDLQEDGFQYQSVNQVLSMIEDRRGDIWLASRSGLLKLNRDLRYLSREPVFDEDLSAATGVAVSAVAELASGEVVVAAMASIQTVFPKSSPPEMITPEAGSLLNHSILTLFVDSKGKLWAGTEGGLSLVDVKSKTARNFIPYSDNPDSKPDNAIETIAEDELGHLWLGTQNGVYVFNPQTENFKRYQHKPNDRFSIANNITREIFVDSKGWVWVGSDTSGLSIYDRNNDRFLRFRHDEERDTSLSSDTIRSIFEDSNGDIWVGVYPSGVNYYNRSSEAISVFDAQSGLSDNLVSDVVEDRNGNLWIGTAGGVDFYDRKARSFKHYQYHGDSTETKIQTNAMLSGFIDSDNDIWFGTWDGGLHLYNAETDRFDVLPFDASLAGTGIKQGNQLSDSIVWNINEDSQKNIWIATHKGGLSKLNKKTGIYTHYSNDPNNPESISNNLVWNSFEDSKGRFWVGTVYGLNLMDRERETFRHFYPDASKPGSLANGSILSIYEDGKQRLWFGTDAGLHLFNENKESFTVYDKKNGFADHGIRSITEDEQGNLWLGTNNGIVRFNPEDQSVKNYTKFAGEKIGVLATGGALRTREGEVVFAGFAGLRLYQVEKLGSNERVPPVALTDFSVFTKSVSINGPDQLLKKSIEQTDKIVLGYKKSMFSFSFSALNFREPEKNQYAYKLDGFDENWREVGTQRKAQYTNLSPGAYTFRVKASNNDGVWNEKGVSVELIQLPPPWKTWWAYCLYVLLALAVIARFLYVQRQKRRQVEEQNRILEQKVIERTSDLAEKNRDIQMLLENMKQGLFTVVSDGSIHHEYSQHLESIFEARELAGRNAFSILFDNSTLNANQKNEVSESMNVIIGSNLLNYEFNAHLLPSEIETQISGKVKHLSLDWNPIEINENVEKLMVSVRDVTVLKEMESQAASKKRELDIISQLLNIPASKYRSFQTSVNKYLKEMQSLVKSRALGADGVATLFRNMHTVKGNSRTLGLQMLSNLAHEAEAYYQELRMADNPDYDYSRLDQGLTSLEQGLKEYEDVYQNVLGRSLKDNQGRGDGGFWLGLDTIEKIKRAIKNGESEAGLSRLMQDVLDQGLYSSLDKLLEDILASLESIAHQLGKLTPKVIIQDNNIRIAKSEEGLIQDCFSHLLRNCLDHGIEPEFERKNAGKTPEGFISISVYEQTGAVCIEVKDDGRGMHLAGLYQKGLKLQKWTERAAPTLSELSDLIFESGVSTREEVSSISGRGVGMDAVKTFLQQAGGDIQLKLLQSKGMGESYHPGESADWMPFSLQVLLPKTCFCIPSTSPGGSGEKYLKHSF